MESAGVHANKYKHFTISFSHLRCYDKFSNPMLLNMQLHLDFIVSFDVFHSGAQVTDTDPETIDFQTPQPIYRPLYTPTSP